MADFSCGLWEAESRKLAVFLVYQELPPLPLETRKMNTGYKKETRKK
jgi:hypothetical protein